MNPAPTLGELLPRLLRGYGIDTVFGIPGVHTAEIYRGLAYSGLRHVTPRHEQGAGFMADGYARASGRPAACLVITGPGVTNLMTAMGQAYSDSVPMLVISSVSETRQLGRGEGRLHELTDQSALAAGVAAFSQTIGQPGELPAALARASEVFASARPRPVHIQIPLDVIALPADGLTPQPFTRERPSPDPDEIARAALLLRGAARPFVVLGGGTVDAAAEAQDMVGRLGAMTALTISAKGVLPAGHPLSLGSRLPQAPVLAALRDADVVLAIGTELAETDTLLFSQTLDLRGQVIRIDIDSGQLQRNTPAAVAIHADAGLAMAALSEALADHSPNGGAECRQVTALRAAADATLPDAYRVHGRLLDRIAVDHPDVILVGDSTQPVYGGNLTYDAGQPRCYFNSSTGYGTLGYGLPAAVGAKLACPDRPVAAIVGDGGLLFTIGELATAVELELALPILAWNNRGYGEIKRYMDERGIPPTGVELYTPDLQALARGFGCLTERSLTLERFATALRQAFAANRPTLIQIDEELALRW
jgi:acetolactate synthase-1/2/3 large subunit